MSQDGDKGHREMVVDVQGRDAARVDGTTAAAPTSRMGRSDLRQVHHIEVAQLRQTRQATADIQLERGHHHCQALRLVA